MGNDILLDVRNLKTYFYTLRGVIKAVDDVSFTIARGRIVGVVGESGCGKSVMARSLVNIIQSPGRIVGGEVIYHAENGDTDLLKLPPKGKQVRAFRGKKIAMIFQEPMISLSPVHTIGDQIGECFRLYYPDMKNDEVTRRSIEMLRSMEIPSPEKQLSSYIFELSGGMRQRVMIAMALSGNPELLIADEPTTAIDVTIQAKVIELLRQIRERTGMSILIITHNMGVVAQMADEIVVMYLGKIVERGNVQDIFSRPSHPYTNKLLFSIPGRNSEPQTPLQTIEGSIPDPYTTFSGCPFMERCSHRADCEAVNEVPPLREIGANHWVRCLHPETNGEEGVRHG